MACVSFISRSVAFRDTIAKYEGRERISLPKPTLTRWYSIAKSSIRGACSLDEDKDYLKNNSVFKMLKQIVYDDIFWIQLQAFDAILKPIVFVQALSEMKQVSSGMIQRFYTPEYID